MTKPKRTGSNPTPIVYSDEWWEAQTSTELHGLKMGSFPSGKAYDGAVTELERRAKLKRERLETWFKFIGLLIGVVGVVVAASQFL